MTIDDWPRAMTSGAAAIASATVIDAAAAAWDTLPARVQEKNGPEPEKYPRARCYCRRGRRRGAHRVIGYRCPARQRSDPQPAQFGPRQRSTEFRKPPNPQCRDAWRQSSAASTLLVFPPRRVSLLEEGRQSLFRDARRKP